MLTINQKVQLFLKSHKHRRVGISVFLILAVIVVLAVVTILIKPAVSMTGDLTCTASEHIHNNECYCDILICGKNEASDHTHDEDCFEQKNILVCYVEDETHTHSDECHEDKEILVCNKIEGEPHSHTQECYENQIVCQKNEHIHDEECYQEKPDDVEDAEEDIEFSEFSNILSDRAVSYYSGTEIEEDVSVNFINYISDVSYKPNNTDNTDENIKPVKFTLTYSLPPNCLMQVNNNKQIYYKLPENVIVSIAQNGPVKTNSVTTGTYQITQDGYIIIDFDSNYVKDGSQQISGDITFNANVKKSDVNSQTESVTMGNVIIDVDFSKASDLSVDKTNSGYNSETSMINYNINVSSVNGSGEGYITIKDYLLNADSSLIRLNLTDGQNIQVTKNNADGSTETVIPEPMVNISADNKVTISNLEALGAGESYTLEYSALLTPGDKARIINANNRVEVSNQTLQAQDTDYLEVVTGCILKKSGNYNDKTDIIEWKITILNPLGTSLDGYTIADDMLKYVIDGSLKVLDKNNTVVGNAGTLNSEADSFILGDLSGSEYKLVYQTHPTEHGKSNKNKAILKNGDTVINDVTGEAYVSNERKYINKTSKGVGYDNDWNVIIEWSVNLEFQQGEFSEKTYTDTMTYESSEHYMTAQQIDELIITGTKPNYESVTLVKDTDYFLKYFDSDGTIIDDISGAGIKIYSYQITFEDNEKVSSLSDMKINYKSIGELTDDMAIGSSEKFYNRAEFDDVTVNSTYTETKKAAIKKYDAISSSQSDTEHKTNQLEKTEDGDYILKWYIIANESNNYGNNSVTLTDNLPSGVSLLENSIKLQVHNGSNYASASGIEYDYDVDHNQVTFNIPASVHNGRAFKIDYSVSVTEDFILNNSLEFYTVFSNTVTDGTSVATQTQKIHFPLISKTGLNPSEVYDGDIVYTIDVNPYAEKLTSDGVITVSDKLKHSPKRDENGNPAATWGYSATLISVTVTDVETQEELNGTQYKLTYQDEEINYFDSYSQFIAELPDERHLEIKYIYHITPNTASTSGYSSYTIKNDAEIEYGGSIQAASHQNTYDLDRESSAHTVTSDYIKIHKVDSDNFAIRLDGAKFNLYRWSDSVWQPMTDEVTQGNGEVQAQWGIETSTPKDLITSNESGEYRLPALEQSVLYKLIEVQAPQNYIISTTPYYFVINSMPYSLPSNVQKTNIQTLLKGGRINIANELLEEIDIKINKHWGENSDIQPVEVQLLRSQQPPIITSEAYTITVNVNDSKNHSLTKNFKVDNNENIELNLKVLDVFWNNSYLKINDVNINIYVTSQITTNLGWTGYDSEVLTSYFKYIFGSINADTVIDIYFGDSQNYSRYEVELSNCTEITDEEKDDTIKIPSDAVQISESVTLDEENEWTHMWTQLPESDSYGNLYYYYVKELTEISGHIAVYDTNGVNGGEINLTNRKTDDIPTLPATGGAGIRHILLFGIILMATSTVCYYLIKRRKINRM